MSDIAEGKRSKERSPAFPFITLERALERVRQFYGEEKRGAAPLSRAVMHWNYSPGSSGALQTIAALRQYGLLEDVGGSGANRQLKLSDLAVRIVVDQREDTSERIANVKAAALSPPIAAEIFERWSDGLPSDGTLHHFLVIEKKFAEAAAFTAVKILKENQRFAPISGSDLQSGYAEYEHQLVIESPNPTLPVARAESVRPSSSRPLPAFQAFQQTSATPIGAQRVLGHAGVTITLQFTEEPTREVFEYLAKYCNFEKDNVPSKAQQRQVEDGEPLA